MHVGHWARADRNTVTNLANLVERRPILLTAVIGVAVLCQAVFLAGTVRAQGQAKGKGQPVTSIEVRGNKRIETSAIRGRLTLKPGDPFTPEAIRAQIPLIYGMGFFEDVQVETQPEPRGVAVTFIIREKPFVTGIVFDGNEHLTENRLKEKITIRRQSFLDQRRVKESAEKIRLAYRDAGFYNAQVIPIIQSLERDRKRLIFFIKEGTKARIKTIVFEGRTAVAKKALLKVMASREWVFLLSLITDAGTLKREELANDMKRIQAVYLDRGYLDIQVGTPKVEISEDKKWFTVTFPIVEGPLYTFGSLEFRGNTVFEEGEIRQGSRIVPGEIFRRTEVLGEKTRLEEMYGRKGYAFVEADPSIFPDRQARTVTIRFTLTEGKLVRVRQIHITGNEKTRDNIIRRELRLSEQDITDSVAMRRSFQRLNNLNYFEKVEILPRQVAPDKVDLDVKVKEKSTGSFSVGGGFSTLSQIFVNANITEGNLFGKGYLARVNGQLGQLFSSGLATFRNPSLYDSSTSFQLDAFRSQTFFFTFGQTRTGGSVTFGRQLTEFVSGSLSIVGEVIRNQDPNAFLNNSLGLFGGGNLLGSAGVTSGTLPEPPQFIQAQFGTQSTTGFRSLLARDTRDFFLDPRTGNRTRVNFDLGSQGFGGSNNFYKFQFDILHFFPLFADVRFSPRFRFGVVEGYGGKPVPLSERFYVGGIQTIRGFYFGRAGPKSPAGFPVGGNRELIFNNDLIFPIAPAAKLNGVLFFDAGNAYLDGQPLNLKLREAVGVEIRWLSPFGPLRAAYGINLNRNRALGEKAGVFEFTVGSVF